MQRKEGQSSNFYVFWVMLRLINMSKIGNERAPQAQFLHFYSQKHIFKKRVGELKNFKNAPPRWDVPPLIQSLNELSKLMLMIIC